MKDKTPIMRSFKMLSLFVMVLLSFHSLGQDEDTNSDAPYIWWYADTHQAFVIERADGSDSHLIAAGINPSDHIIFEDTAFSPSGEWLAWRSERPKEGGFPAFKGYVVRVDGSERLDLLDDIEQILLMRWSPTHDWLFVVYVDVEHYLHLVIVDVPNAEVLAEPDFFLPYGSRQTLLSNDAFIWSVNGEEAYYMPERFDETLPRFVLTGHGQADVYTPDGFRNSAGEFLIRDIQGSDPYTVLENSSTQQQIMIESTIDSDAIYVMKPNPTRTHILLESSKPSKENDEGTEKQTRLIDLADGTVTSVNGSLFTRDCIYWISCESLITTPIWSQDGKYALLKGDAHSWNLLDVNKDEVKEILPVDNTFSVDQWYWVNQNSELIFVQEDPFEVYRYAIESGQITQIDLYGEPPVLRVFPSPDGRYMGRWALFKMLDTLTKREITWVEHSAGQRGSGLWFIDWYKDSQWFFTTDDTMYAGGGGAATGRTIHHVDGMRRELGDCYGTCIGFLPDEVVAGLPEGSPQSVVSEPLAELLHEGQVYGVDWSPDGTSVMAFEYVDRDNMFLAQWDVSSDEPMLMNRYPLDFDCRPYPFSCPLTWNEDNTILLNNSESIATFDLDSVEVIAINQVPESQYFRSPDGHFEVVGLWEEDEPVRLQDTITEEILFELEIRGSDIAWGSDNQSFFLGGYSEEGDYFWDGTQLHTLEDMSYAYAIDYDPDSGLLVAGSFFRRMAVWDVANGQALTPINWNARDMAFSPDGRRLAAAGTQYITIWDMTHYQR